MKRFGIKSGDNDFYNTFSVMMPVVANAIVDQDPNITREKLIKILKESIYVFYRLGQNLYMYNHGYEDHIKNYLESMISEESLFIDDQINEELVRLGDNTNGEFFCCDLPSEYSKGYFYSF